MSRIFCRKLIFILICLFLFLPPFFHGGKNYIIENGFLVFTGLLIILFLCSTYSSRSEPAGLDASIKNPKFEIRNPKFRFHRESSMASPSGQIPNSKFQIPNFFLLLFLIFLFLSSFFSASPYDSFLNFLKFLSLAILFFIVSRIKFSSREIKIFFLVILSSGFILSLIGIYNYLLGSYPRLTSTFYWPNPFAGYLLLVLPIAGMFVFSNWTASAAGLDAKKTVSQPERARCPSEARTSEGEGERKFLAGKFDSVFSGGKPENRGQIISIFAFILILSAFILTFSRGAYLSLIFSLIFAFCLVRFKIKKNILPIIFLILIAILLSFSLYSLRGQTGPSFQREKQAGQVLDISSQTRLNYWQGALEIFKDYPIFGSGLKTFQTIYPSYQKSPLSAGRSAHNFYIQLLSETGIFASLAFFLFLISIGWQSIKKIRKNYSSIDLVILTGLFASILHNFLDIDFEFLANQILFFFLAGVLVSRTEGLLRDKNFLPGSQAVSLRKPSRRPSGQGSSDPELVEGERESEAERERNFLAGEIDSVFSGDQPRAEAIKIGLYFLSLLLVLSGLVGLLSDYHFSQGQIAQGNFDLEKTEKEYRKSLFLNPDPNKLNYLGIILYSRSLIEKNYQKFLEAEQYSEKAIKLDKKDSQNWLLRGRIALLKGENLKAEESFKKMIGLDPLNFPIFYFDLANLYLSQEKTNQAKETIFKVLKNWPDEIVERRKGIIMPGQVITSGVEKDISLIYYLLGETFQKENNLFEAKKSWQKALDFDPENNLAKKRL